ncbi:MAG: phenylalanine--tRNA ligase subunit beta [Geobacteraceae bacterium]|nr:phenylalanine--tRNA ligase subunit beta [Geobacteraceae bacterium]
MIVTYNWLKEFVDVELPAAELADLLTMLGLEVERMESRGEGMDEVVVALVQEKAQHPNADKLSLCKVNDGREILDIVCGAQNFKAGDRVALARIGAVLPGGLKIKRSKIRGEESFGMLCSEKELGLADESAGIMVLPPDLPLGVPLFEAMGLKDTIFEIGLTPNRADCLSVIGIAREIAAKLGKKISYPGLEVPETGVPISDIASVQVEDPQLCPRYTARYVSGCTIAPSPQWLADRLKAVGLRPINNVVDVTNYVLIEFGHPLHAFDFDLLSGGKIIVRRGADGESFTTLDGQPRHLKASDLTIRDAAKVIALAGVMGGENSEISPGTTNILLESAYFKPSAIRLTAKRLGLHTESSHRFERGTDFHVLTKALDRAASLIAQLSGGSVAQGTIDVSAGPVERKKVPARLDHINRLLGTNLAAEEVIRIFHSLEFTVEIIEPGLFEVEAPSFRVDIEREIDLVEEVARLHGYDKIPVTMPKARVFSDRPTRHQKLENRVKDLLVAHGFNEVVNFSFISPDCYDKILLESSDPRRDSIGLLNPLVAEQSVMRTALLPGILETAARNVSFRVMNQRIFEMRRVYLPRAGRELPDEPINIAALLTGLRDPEGWNQQRGEVDFYDAKGVVENLLDQLKVLNVAYDSSEVENFYHPGKSCNITVNGEVVGSLGEIHPTVQENYGFEKPLYYFEMNFEKLVLCCGEEVAVQVPPRFPDTFRDIAMVLDDGTPAAEILNCIRSLREKEIEGAEIFDLYKGEHIPSGQKSIAVRVRYRSPERTLADEEITRLHTRVVETMIKKLNVSIR